MLNKAPGAPLRRREPGSISSSAPALGAYNRRGSERVAPGATCSGSSITRTPRETSFGSSVPSTPVQPRSPYRGRRTLGTSPGETPHGVTGPAANSCSPAPALISYSLPSTGGAAPPTLPSPPPGLVSPNVVAASGTFPCACPGPPPGLSSPRVAATNATQATLIQPPALPCPSAVTGASPRPGRQPQVGITGATIAQNDPDPLGSPWYEAGQSSTGDLDSFDDETELLRCQAELVEAAAEIGATTSADDDLFTTDADLDDEDDSLGSLGLLGSLPGCRPWQTWQRSSVTAVIEEDEEGISSGWDDDCLHSEVGRAEIRSRLWAQSLLRLKRSIDEIYSLCEYESDETLCQEVRTILSAASNDFLNLIEQLGTQQEYSLLPSDIPVKCGVAWTTRTPSVARSGESVLEQFERAQQQGSPTHSSVLRSRVEAGPNRVSPRSRIEPPRARSPSVEASGGGTGEACVPRDVPENDDSNTGGGSADISVSTGGREENLDSMVQSALRRIQLRQQKNKLTPEELQKKSEDRHRRAQQLKASMDDQRMMQGKQTESKILAARERRQEREQTKQRELLEKMTRARRKYQDQLRAIGQRARRHNVKSAEVAFIAKEAIKGEREILKQKHAKAHISRMLMQEKMRKKLIASAERVARVSENRRNQLQSWQFKVQQSLEEKERLAEQRRREHIHSIKAKSQGQESRSETVRDKRREIQIEDEKSTQDFLRFRSKNIGRLAMNCDGLPTGVREEVNEQIQSSPTAPATSNAVRKKATAGAPARPQATFASRVSTPPPLHERSPTTPKTFPGANECSDSEDQPQDEVLRNQLDSPVVVSDPALEQLDSPVADSAGRARLSPNRPVRAGAELQSPTESPSKPTMAKSASGCIGPKLNSRAGPPRRPGEDLRMSRSPPGGSGNRTQKRGPSVGSVGTSDSFDDVPASEVGSEVAAKLAKIQQEREEAVSRTLERLRARLCDVALADDDAYKAACEGDEIKPAAVTTAHRARLSKLANDLKKLHASSGGAAGSSGGSDDVPVKERELNFDRVDTVLVEFNRVLGQSLREADFAHVIKLGCLGIVVDICTRIKESIKAFAMCTEKLASPVWVQLSNVMLSALKWLGLVCKYEFACNYMVASNRVVAIADIAFTCMDVQLGEAAITSTQSDSQGPSVLFLPQVLHVLSLPLKHGPPSASNVMRTLLSFLLLCGLPEKFRELFRRTEVRGMKLFEVSSPVPLILLRAIGLLSNVMNAYCPSAEALRPSVVPPLPVPAAVAASGGASASAATAEDAFVGHSEQTELVLSMLRRTEIFGVVTVLVSILQGEGRQTATKLPNMVVSLAFQAVRILNAVARLNLATLQETLGACRRQEIYHLLVCLIDYCTMRLGRGKPEKTNEENELLHETIMLLGFYCLQTEDNQGIMCYGEGQTLLVKITSLPLHYFMDPVGRSVLFPTILSTCFQSPRNLALLSNEMNLSLLRNFLEAGIKNEQAAPSEFNFAGCFPIALWPEALNFFSDESVAVVLQETAA